MAAAVAATAEATRGAASRVEETVGTSKGGKVLFGHSLFRAPQLDRTRADGRTDAQARSLAHFCTDMVD